jgi:hypothetical protein
MISPVRRHLSVVAALASMSLFVGAASAQQHEVGHWNGLVVSNPPGTSSNGTAVWTDMRPLSLRKKMEEGDQSASSTPKQSD